MTSKAEFLLFSAPSNSVIETGYVIVKRNAIGFQPSPQVGFSTIPPTVAATTLGHVFVAS